MEHGAPPDHRLVLAGEEAHGDAADAASAGGRDEHGVDDRGRLVDPEHARDREAPHVGVDHGHAAAPLGEGHGEVQYFVYAGPTGADRYYVDAWYGQLDQQIAQALKLEETPQKLVDPATGESATVPMRMPAT